MESMDRRQYYKDLVGIENETLQSLELSEEKPGHHNHHHHHHSRFTPANHLSSQYRESQGISNNSDQQQQYEKSQTVFLPSPLSSKQKNKLEKQVHFQKGLGGYVNSGFISSFPHHPGSKLSKSKKSRPKSCPVGGREEITFDSNKTREQSLFRGVKDDIGGEHKLNFSASTPVKSGNKTSKPLREGETMSPHYMRRHRNREQEYNRSMKQVAEWIERQHDWVTSPEQSPQQPVVQHHEHHHIHEHHHHYHFYHYYET